VLPACADDRVAALTMVVDEVDLPALNGQGEHAAWKDRHYTHRLSHVTVVELRVLCLRVDVDVILMSSAMLPAVQKMFHKLGWVHRKFRTPVYAGDTHNPGRIRHDLFGF
jgi:hypothetical protein